MKIFTRFSTHLILFLFVFTLSVQGQTHLWQNTSINTLRDFYEIETSSDTLVLISGDSGTVAMRSNNAPWTLLQAQTNKALVSVELIKFNNLGWKPKITTETCEIFSPSTNGQNLIEDTLPTYLAPYHKTRKLVNLNISTLNETRFGIISDSGKIVGYKFPFSSPRFDITLATQKPVRDLYPFSMWNILAIADSGKIWKAVALSEPFQPINHSLTTQKLNKIIGKKDDKIWIAGDSGLVLYTQNGGQSWVKLLVPTTKNIYSGSIINNTLWLCGAEGLILFSNDEGQNWAQDNSNTLNDLTDIRVLPNEVIACGKGGVIRRLNLLTSNQNFETTTPFSIINDGKTAFIENQSRHELTVQLISLDGKKHLSKTVGAKAELEIYATLPGVYIVLIQDEKGLPFYRKIILQP